MCRSADHFKLLDVAVCQNWRRARPTGRVLTRHPRDTPAGRTCRGGSDGGGRGGLVFAQRPCGVQQLRAPVRVQLRAARQLAPCVTCNKVISASAAAACSKPPTAPLPDADCGKLTSGRDSAGHARALPTETGHVLVRSLTARRAHRQRQAPQAAAAARRCLFRPCAPAPTSTALPERGKLDSCLTVEPCSATDPPGEHDSRRATYSAG